MLGIANTFLASRGSSLGLSFFPNWTGLPNSYFLPTAFNSTAVLLPVEDADELNAARLSDFIAVYEQPEGLLFQASSNLISASDLTRVPTHPSAKLVCAAARRVGNKLQIAAVLSGNDGFSLCHSIGDDFTSSILAGFADESATVSCAIDAAGNAWTAARSAKRLFLARKSAEGALATTDIVHWTSFRRLVFRRRGNLLNEPGWDPAIEVSDSPRQFANATDGQPADIPPREGIDDYPAPRPKSSEIRLICDDQTIRLYEVNANVRPGDDVYVASASHFAAVNMADGKFIRGVSALHSFEIAKTLSPTRARDVCIGPARHIAAINSTWIESLTDVTKPAIEAMVSMCEREVRTYKIGTEAERTYFCQHPFNTVVGLTIGLYARSEFKGIDNEGDAMRHAFWASMLTQHLGIEAARAILANHENKPVEDGKVMDTFNNSVGVYIGTRFPNASPDQLKEIIRGYAKRGLLQHKGNPGAAQRWAKETAFKDPDSGTRAIREARDVGRDNPREGRDRDGPGDRSEGGGLRINTNAGEGAREREAERQRLERERRERDDFLRPVRRGEY